MTDDLTEQFARMGVTIEGAPAQLAPEVFEVMWANDDAIAAWLACETQWRVIVAPGAVMWLGLDYPAVDVVLRRLGIADPDQVFADLRLMEGEALSVMRETSG